MDHNGGLGGDDPSNPAESAEELLRTVLGPFRSAIEVAISTLRSTFCLDIHQQSQLLHTSLMLALCEAFQDSVDETVYNKQQTNITLNRIIDEILVSLTQDRAEIRHSEALKTAPIANDTVTVSAASCTCPLDAYAGTSFQQVVSPNSAIRPAPPLSELSSSSHLLVLSHAEWNNVPQLIQRTANEAGRLGFSIVKHPSHLSKLLQLGIPEDRVYTRHHFPGNVQNNGTITTTYRDEDITRGGNNDAHIVEDTTENLIAQFQNYLVVERRSAVSEMEVLYASSIPAWTSEERLKAGLPLQSPIWPLEGNKLVETREVVLGLHTPYAYRSLTKWSPFHLHREDFDLFSFNYLYVGEKTWVIISPESLESLENQLRTQRFKCAQFLRHGSTWIPIEVLTQWCIQYQIIRQRAGNVVIIHPKAYHQGFSVGVTVAEAVNYAESAWKPDNYACCSKRTCSGYSIIERKKMELLGEGEQQRSPDLTLCSLSNPADKTAQLLAVVQKPPRPTQRNKEVLSKPGTQLRLSIITRKSDNYLPSNSSKSLQSSNQSTSKRKLRPGDEGARVGPNLIKHPKVWHEGVISASSLRAATKLIAPVVPPTQLDFFTRFWFSIGSATAIRQLKAACLQTLCQEKDAVDEANVGSLVSYLLKLEAIDFKTHVLRRYLMAHLLLLRQAAALEKRCLCCTMCQAARNNKISFVENSETAAQSGDKSGRCRALDALQNPLLRPEEAKIQRRKLIEALSRGKVWYALSQRFGIGILALIPNQETFGVNSNNIQRTFDVADFGKFFDLFDARRGKHVRDAAELLQGIFDRLIGKSIATTWNFEKNDCSFKEGEEIDSVLSSLCERKI